jgi:hypothetical protein
MDELLTSIAMKKERLDAMRPVSRAALLALQKAYDVDLTYTSNAIEGNTLPLRETAEFIEHGITAGGKPLRDHLEARSMKTPCANCTGALSFAANPISAVSTAHCPAALPDHLSFSPTRRKSRA